MGAPFWRMKVDAPVTGTGTGFRGKQVTPYPVPVTGAVFYHTANFVSGFYDIIR